MRGRRGIAVLALTGLLAACESQPVRGPAPWGPSAAPVAPDKVELIAASFAQLPGWTEDAQGQGLAALNRTCSRLSHLSPESSVGADGIGGTVADWHGPCAQARRLDGRANDQVRAFFENWFIPYLVTQGGSPEGLFTGYFEPELAGSRKQSARFSVPILARPRDLLIRDGGNGEQQVGRLVNGQFQPYSTRAEIEAGKLGNFAQPIAWVEDPVDAHILHIQGSGRLRLEDGTVLRLGVAATNGHKFVGIGRILKEKGLIDDSSMPAIRAWLKANPAQARSIMVQNPRYVFYRIVGGDGPIGSEGVALTPERSLAVDRRFIPMGVPVYLDTVDPQGRPLRRLMMAQDTGAAIKGAVRGDFFWGAGEAAFQQAGRMKSTGRYWVLLPRNRSPRMALAIPDPGGNSPGSGG